MNKFLMLTNLANVEYGRFKENDGPNGYSNGSSFDFSLVSDGLGISAFYVFGGK